MCLMLNHASTHEKNQAVTTQLALLDWFYIKKPDWFLCLYKTQGTCIQIILKHAVAKSIFKMSFMTGSLRAKLIHYTFPE